MNTELFFLVFNLAHQNFFLDTLMIFIADYLIFIVFGVLLLLRIFGTPKYKFAFAVSLISAIVVSLIIELIHSFNFIPRPFVAFPIFPLINLDPTESAFPSQHTAVMASAAFSYYFYHAKIAPILFVITILIGFSRIFTGVHYPLDILGGILLGFVVSLVIIKILHQFLK